MSEETKTDIRMRSGTCRFCGQSHMVETEATDQATIDCMATDMCDCPDAKSERRLQERAQKKKNYLDERFTDGAVRDYMERSLDIVDSLDSGVEYVQVKMTTGHTHKIYMTKDYDLKIKVTKKNEEETTI